MFKGFSKQTVDFLWSLRLNNNREWYHEHKEECKQVLTGPMNALAEQVLDTFKKQRPDLDMTVHMSRIYRDARRLYGRGPFKDYLWFSVHDGRLEHWAGKPSFWFELGADEWSYGVGCWESGASFVRKIRVRINSDPAPLLELDELLQAQSEFVLTGRPYKKMPAGLAVPQLAHWYSLRDISISHSEPVGPAITTEEFGRRICDGMMFLSKFYDYLYPIGRDRDPLLDEDEDMDD